MKRHALLTGVFVTGAVALLIVAVLMLGSGKIGRAHV